MVRGQDLSLLCLTCAHDLTTHKHLALSVSRARLTLILLLLSFEDHLLLLRAQVTSIGRIRVYRLTLLRRLVALHFLLGLERS